MDRLSAGIRAGENSSLGPEKFPQRTFASRAPRAIEWADSKESLAHPSVGRHLHQISEAILTTSIAGATNRSPKLGETHCARIPAGWFMMGCEQGRDEEKPVHRVWVDEFEMAVYQVRNRNWAEFMEATGHPAPPNWADSEFQHPDQPVVSVSWHEAAKYCDWLSAAAGRRYRLPTEAEWERAARGGRENELYPWGDTPPHEWPEYLRRWSGDIRCPLPVGQGTPNPYGLYDIGENVHEWCADWFDKDYYRTSPERNPAGPSTGARRASRGGSWRHQIKVSRSAARASIPPEFQYADYGFRVVRNVL